jgi:hypothetical protein
MLRLISHYMGESGVYLIAVVLIIIVSLFLFALRPAREEFLENSTSLPLTRKEAMGNEEADNISEKVEAENREKEREKV